MERFGCVMYIYTHISMDVLYGLWLCITHVLYKVCGYGLVVVVYCTFSYYDDIKPFLISAILQGKKSMRAHIRTYIHTGENGEEILTSFTSLELMGFPCLSVAPSATMIILRREPRKRLCRTNTGGLKQAVCVHWHVCMSVLCECVHVCEHGFLEKL